MNVFFTNTDPKLAAQDHCKVHTRKMLVEYHQLLSTAHHELSDNPPEGIYKPTHRNHPSAIWVRESEYHYKWLFVCLTELHKIYTENTGKIHKSKHTLKALSQLPDNIPRGNVFNNPKPAMPNEHLVWNAGIDVVASYRKYLNAKFKEWSCRERKVDVSWYGKQPEWIV